ncbi:MAG: class I SAM-dependent methyltransferase [Rhodobacter sp.]|uniref:class I SAM-dependent methyltransferase n=1 Tax=Pararhodobacter sp. TaxID=2127056 RepID=UPI001D5D02D0|nr:methyltransferase [Pararhodobacter sp.]MCB1345780.1 class I SAM-dependent methyltransferase [Paracoccaceae bacterium]MCC0073971.1 class I SAM-dependent methyltransferase [Rhodobacter sp.]HPD91319.1 methyltransferase domain-containing protein [Pararhodobacter sp.]
MTDAAFWDRVARAYAARPVANPDAWETTLTRTRAHLRPGDRVLEVGCGTASTAIRLAPHVAAITASDIAAGMVTIGREKLAAAGIGNVTCVQGALGDAALGPGPYDAVLAFNLLHLTRDPGAEAAHAHALLKPGGLFITKTACLSGRYRLLQPVIAAMRLIGRAPWVNFLSIERLERQIADAGFQIVETGNYPAAPPARFIVARKG